MSFYLSPCWNLYKNLIIFVDQAKMDVLSNCISQSDSIWNRSVL